VNRSYARHARRAMLGVMSKPTDSAAQWREIVRVGQAVGELVDQTELPIDLTRQQGAAVGGQCPATEIGVYFSSRNA
jgi:hypothetical protein